MHLQPRPRWRRRAIAPRHAAGARPAVGEGRLGGGASLKAKVYGQMGRFTEGIVCCEAILAQEAGHEDAKRCLAGLRREQGRSAKGRKVIRLLKVSTVAAPVVLALALGAIWLVLRGKEGYAH